MEIIQMYKMQKPDPANPIYAAEFQNAFECLMTHCGFFSGWFSVGKRLAD